MKNNYVSLHTHTTLSLLDSTSTYEQMVDLAVEFGMPAIAFTEHGHIYSWIKKKQYCDKKGIKYIHGIEMYMTESLDVKERDNYHVVLLAKNWEGVLEINKLYTKSTDKEHTYYKNRMSFDEFLGLSDNVLALSACLGGVLNKLDDSHKMYSKLVDRFDYLEVHNHIAEDQLSYNKRLVALGKPLVACGDFHEISDYKSDCRKTWKSSKGMSYEGEDDFDLVMRGYDDFRNGFIKQGVLSPEQIDEAISNTLAIADLVENFELDETFKFPDLYEGATELIAKESFEALDSMIELGFIDKKKYNEYEARVITELEAFGVLGMESFILFMSEVMTKAKDEGWAIGPARGSASGSLVCYLLRVTDVDPLVWGTNFTRFINVNRISLPDIDSDWAPEDRPKVFKYIQDRFGVERSSYITTFQKLGVKKIVEDIGRALSVPIPEVASIKEGYAEIEIKETMLKRKLDGCEIGESEFESQMEEIDKEYEQYLSKFDNIFHYYEGLKGTISSVGYHPAGMIGSPTTITDNIGLRYNSKTDGWISSCDMKAVDGQNYVKYDILSLKTLQVIKHTYSLLGKEIPQSAEMDWNDKDVFNSMNISNVGLFQFESQSAFQYLNKFNCESVYDIAFVTAIIRPSCASFRDDAINRVCNVNTDNRVDSLLKETLGYLTYQEQQIEFLQKMCGFTEGEADVVRRAIGKKSQELLDLWMPKIEEGYVKNSPKSKEEALSDFKQFMIVFLQSVNYSFSKNHAIAYSMITYMTAYLRHYHPKEFLASYLNNATDESDIQAGTRLAKTLGIEILNPTYGKSRANYSISGNAIYKGMSSILYVSEKCSQTLQEISSNKMDFRTLCEKALSHSTINTRQMSVLIKVDFFREYGPAKKLFEFFTRFCEYNDRKTFKKEGIPKGTEAIIQRFLTSGLEGFSETAKQYKIDGKVLCDEIFKLMKSVDYSPTERIISQLSYLGYIQDESLNTTKIGTIMTNKTKLGAYKVDFIDGTGGWYKFQEKQEPNKGDMIVVNIESTMRNGRYTEKIITHYDTIELDRQTRK